MRLLICTAFLLILAKPAAGQIVQLVEAEDCTIHRIDAKPLELIATDFASGGKRLGDFWGERPGDRIEFKLDLKLNETKLKLALRYSFNQSHYQSFTRNPIPERNLKLTIDAGEPIDLAVPDTGSWDDFECVIVDLPALKRGHHTFALSSPADHLTTDIDAFIFFRGIPEKVLPPPLRKTLVIRSDDNRFSVRMTPKAGIRQTPEQVFRDFDRIYDFFESYMGWKPDRGLIRIHVYDAALRTGTFENGYGINFEDDNFNVDRGNWIHEMNHVFDNGLFPDWTGHPMIRLNDTFVTGPQIFPEHWGGPSKDPQWQIRLNAGRQVLNNPRYRTDDPHEILYAMYAKFGKDILRRFYAECRAAKARGEIKFVRDNPLTRDEYVKYMSAAAGEDVRQYFERWTGFATAN